MIATSFACMHMYMGVEAKGHPYMSSSISGDRLWTLSIQLNKLAKKLWDLPLPLPSSAAPDVCYSA